ncbi:hypothetical protein U8527_20180 [Kordia algicida OT-1]|uniref:Uncharacterized protein n=1 Tax=Kordia algicida OT-1 TaxID=391587 RepID=A9DKF2_9FLAO|nr:hypothetical protein [Kordia algicida]EDP98314.1 hypothetical protein KAOT1_13892 [Kordia algicida OT-1]
MSRATKDTIQKILLIALGAMTVSMVLISVFNYKDNRQKNDYLEHEKVLVEEELTVIIKSYSHIANHHTLNADEINVEKEKAEKLLDNLKSTVLDYESIIEYRRKMLELRKNNHRLQETFHKGMSAGAINTTY